MKKNFNQYFKIPLIFFIISLSFFTLSALNAVHPFRNQSYNRFGSIILLLLAIVFCFLKILYLYFSYKSYKDFKKKDKKISKGENC